MYRSPLSYLGIVQLLGVAKQLLSGLALRQSCELCDHGRMPDVQVIAWIRDKYTAIEADLDERARR